MDQIYGKPDLQKRDNSTDQLSSPCGKGGTPHYSAGRLSHCSYSTSIAEHNKAIRDLHLKRARLDILDSLGDLTNGTVDVEELIVDLPGGIQEALPAGWAVDEISCHEIGIRIPKTEVESVRRRFCKLISNYEVTAINQIHHITFFEGWVEDSEDLTGPLKTVEGSPGRVDCEYFPGALGIPESIYDLCAGVLLRVIWSKKLRTGCGAILPDASRGGLGRVKNAASGVIHVFGLDPEDRFG
ncbi:hypothetical protein ABW19_dt0209900 [Dactylella cylindrospora]|nr:hypothetical protein ABW19_dt0209900 [Dactylella cylindrospora]